MTVTLDPDDSPGRRLLGGAWAFLKSAELLHADDPNGLAWAACFSHLAFAAELGLKGFLRQKGLTEAEQRTLGHKLIRAYDAAVDRGFAPTHPLQAKLVYEIAPHHADTSLRYLKGTSVDLPRLEDAIAVARSLLLALHTQAVQGTTGLAQRQSRADLH